MNILVTGGLSHLGTNFINLYSNKFTQLVFIDKISYCSNNNTDIINSNNIISIYGDINTLDIDFILNFYKIDIILHCAASTHVDRSYTHFNEFIDNNIKATIKLLDSAKIYPYLKKFIHISTDEVYGGNNNKIVTEEDKFNPTNPYSGSKAAIENIINSYIYTYKLPIFIDEILQLYRNKNTLEIDEIKKNQRSYDLFLLLKYIGNHNKCDKIKDMSRDDKLNLIKKIIQDIIII